MQYITDILYSVEYALLCRYDLQSDICSTLQICYTVYYMQYITDMLYSLLYAVHYRYVVKCINMHYYTDMLYNLLYAVHYRYGLKCIICITI